MLVSAANMRLKLGEGETAAAMYRQVLADSSLLPAEREMATRKLGEAQASLDGMGGGGGGGGATMGTLPGCSTSIRGSLCKLPSSCHPARVDRWS